VELINSGDLTALPAPGEVAAASNVAFVAYSSTAGKTVAMTHADLTATADDVVGLPDQGRVCLAFVPMCNAHDFPLLTLGLPAAEATTVLMLPASDSNPRAAVVVHGATDVVATPKAAEVLAAPMPQDGRLSSLRRVAVAAPVPLAAGARLEFHRRLPWVELTELYGAPEKETEEVQMTPVELGSPVLSQTVPAVMPYFFLLYSK
jgi:hypothetical protein